VKTKTKLGTEENLAKMMTTILREIKEDGK
jgi:hypothetical protein